MRQILAMLAIAATVATLVAGTVVVLGMPGQQISATTQSSSMSSSSSSIVPSSSSSRTSTTGTITPLLSTSFDDLNDGLQLRLSLNTTTVAPGEPFTITVSEFNTLSTANNASAANLWAIVGLELGPCGHSYGPDQGPLGVAVFSGRYTATNVSQAEPLGTYPYPIVCPQYIRLITAFLFQPVSDTAYVLPSLGGTPVTLSGNVTISREYPVYSSLGQPLSPGWYTLVGGDEWGNLAFLYVDVS